ncbi:MAG: EH signature domain-containing protein [Bacteroidales bacterium]
MAKRIKRLKKIDEQFQTAEIPKDNSIQLALIKFKLGVSKGDAGMYLDSIRLYRRFSYCLSMKHERYTPILDSLSETRTALKLLDNNWRHSYILGLFSSLLNQWENNNPDSIEYLRKFFINKLSIYSGNSRMINSIRKNLSYFDTQDGPVKLGLQLYFANTSINKMTTYLELPANWVTFSYFSKVINVYFNKVKSDITRYENIIELLSEHNSIYSYKRVLSQMIIELDHNNNESIYKIVRDIAFKKIGDSYINSKWAAPSSFTSQEAEDLTKAQEILNQWITSQFISVFFEVCINDEDRRVFWLERAKFVSSFKIFGSNNMFNKLIQDQRISSFVKSRFKTTSNKNVAAIMMHIGNYYLIEFSNDGYALLSYKRNSSYCPSMDGEYESVEELRNSNMPKLSVRNGSLADYYSQEGRLFHNGYWQRPFRQYLEAHVIE